LLQRAYNEHVEIILASFNAGYTGTPGRPVRFAMPGTAEEALRIAITVAQAELQAMWGESSYLGPEIADITAAGTLR
jgi:hypothetical protein